jgi:hypothetical protein
MIGLKPLKGLLKKLCVDRGEAKVATKKRQEAEAKFKAANIALWDKEDLLKIAVANGEKTIRAEALEYYGINGNKKVLPGVNVADGTARLYDPADALQWAIEHKMCLKLDDAAFDLLCQDTKTMPKNAAGEPIAVEVPKPFVRIDTDLEKIVEAL